MQKQPKSNERVAINRISVPKPQHVLAEHLRESILRGEIAEGAALPSERDLVSQTGLSRGAVREALRTLSIEGLVETRHGRFGGSVVTLPDHDSVASVIQRFVTGRRLSLRSLQETREMLEPFLARLAALRRSQEALEELKALHAELVAAANNFNAFASINVKWHIAIAKASDNELLAALLYSISHGLQVATSAEEYDSPETRQKVIHIHSRIMDAIEAKDADLAERSMRQHINATNARPLTISTAQIPLTEELATEEATAPAGAAKRPSRRVKR